MYWNYRIVQKPVNTELNTHRYAIHEVCYDRNDNMKSMTKQEVSFQADNIKDLSKMMLEALEKPIIVWDKNLKKPVEILLK